MKTQLLIYLCFVSVLSSPCRSQETATKSVQQSFEAAVTAQSERDFERFSEILHPRGLRIFRAYLDVIFKKLAESYTADVIADVTGIGGSPGDSTLSDKALFIELCKKAAKLEPLAFGDEKLLPLTFHGVVFSDNKAFVVYQYANELKAEESSVTFQQPRLATFSKLGNSWMMISGAFTDTIPAIWSRELRRRNEQKTNSANKAAQTDADKPSN